VSLFKKTGKILGSAAKLTGQLGAQAVKLSGDALHGTTQIVKAHEHEIGSVAKAAVALSGRALQASGQALAQIPQPMQALAQEVFACFGGSSERQATMTLSSTPWSWRIFLGQEATQSPQPVQTSSFTWGSPFSPRVMPPKGQALAQSPYPRQPQSQSLSPD